MKTAVATPGPPAVRVLYEDNHLVAVFKPAGLLSQGDRSGDTCLADIVRADLKQRHHKPGEVYLGTVQRLDRPVAGLVLFARTSKAAGRLCRQFREHSVAKVYWAWVHGAVTAAQQVFEQPLWRPPDRDRTEVLAEPVAGARWARLEMRRLGWQREFSWLEIRPQTGRKHQIRAQLAAFGHPVLGDRRYGSPLAPRSQAIALFARSLTFVHPTRQVELTLTADLPDDWPWPRPHTSQGSQRA